MSILTKCNIKDESGKTVDTRTVETNEPAILQSGVTLKQLVSKLGEQHIVKDVQDQEIIKFRSQLRTKLAARDDNGDYKHSEEEIANVDYTDWVSEMATRKSPEEKAAEILGKLSSDEIKAALALAEKQQQGKEA